MNDAVSPLTAWENFYVIVGSSGRRTFDRAQKDFSEASVIKLAALAVS